MSASRDAFTAIADPTRRAILDLLRDEPSLTAGQLAQRFPHMSRPAVSDIVARSFASRDSCRRREEGREWHYTLDPALADIYENWLRDFAPLWDESLSRASNAGPNDPDNAGLAEPYMGIASKTSTAPPPSSTGHPSASLAASSRLSASITE